ncbi:MAG: NAD(P)H-dependent flavin oxidoreductase [Promethearchaeota archaeon]
MKWKTKITEIVKCKYPIMLGAFQKYDNARLTAAISEAGGFGVLTASSYKNDEKFRNAIHQVKEITKNPFGINFSISKEILGGHRFFRFIEVAKEEGVKTIITAAYKIENLSKQIKKNDMIWIHKATTMKHAISGEKMGADAIILTGLEGGGLKNPNQNTFLINMVNAKKLLKKPFIASGGISNSTGYLAALMLGAQAVHMCTAFLATTESPIPDSWKQKIIETNCFDPNFIKKVYNFQTDKPKYTDMSMAAGSITAILPAKDLIKTIINEAEEILKNLGYQNELIDFTCLSNYS